MQCNYMTQTERHVDDYNEGASNILALGEFSGGELVTEV